MQCRKKSSGFTLLELLAVVTIMGIIASVVLSRVSHQALDAKKKCCSQYKGDINASIERYHFDLGGYPSEVSELEGTYYPDVVPKCPVTQLDYEIDSATGRILGHNH